MNDMKITLLDKSGYVVTTNSALLVFDYYNDPEKALEKLMRNHPSLPVIFLVSGYGDNLTEHELRKEKEEKLKHHIHNMPRYEREEIDPDSVKKHMGGTKRDHQWHFNHDMFNLAQDRKRVYVMPQDVDANAIRNDVDIAWIEADGIIDADRLPGKVKVQAYATNSKALSYLVTMPDGTTVFYGGNYSNWHLESDAFLAKESFDGFLKSLHHVQNDASALTVLFFPVNPTLGDTCTEQAQIMLKNIKVQYFVPMEFAQQTDKACNFTYLPAGVTGICLHSPSQTVKLGAEGPVAVPD